MGKKYDYLKARIQINPLVADVKQIQTVVHQVHSYMRGRRFFNLHPEMEEFNSSLVNTK